MSDIAENSASLLAGLSRGESLPARWYTDPAITEREIHQIFRKTWNYIGPLDELEKVGEEDDALTDSVQRGLRAGIPEKGHFQRMVASSLVGDEAR
jgi:phenylpropionate dioxygenase-like ring-hydroxylating dioxygenase large terminal subunit